MTTRHSRPRNTRTIMVNMINYLRGFKKMRAYSRPGGVFYHWRMLCMVIADIRRYLRPPKVGSNNLAWVGFHNHVFVDSDLPRRHSFGPCERCDIELPR
ncbi:hypothetical protein M378DRAFT_660086 [Amanita muscaria Koide BX008]|uniref:Uncharacterized protein n=1 Tax=Amanita muscaria (strain Koide BX008) TaxID=946122 RepID=A0A0C2X4I8_AMAMK|nr:hypothetical protein M378DRAFT_660086 [Amanita muscaria Koide BX008]